MERDLPQDEDLKAFSEQSPYRDIPPDPDLKYFKETTTQQRIADEAALDKALRDARPSALADGFGIRGPAVRERQNLNEVRRTDASPGDLLRREQPPDFPSSTTSSTSTVVVNIHPFKVTKMITAGVTKLKVYPGRIASIIPMLGGVQLDNNPAPSLTVTATAPFSLLLRAKISVDTDNLFRSAIGLFPPTGTDNGIKVCTDNDADVIPDIVGSEVPELVIFWENAPTNTIGHFYILIANIDANGDSQVTRIIQWLFSSYSTFVATGSEVQIII